MNIDTIVSRLKTVNNQLMTISSFRRIQDMSGKCGKPPCTCIHHQRHHRDHDQRSISRSRSSAGKCNGQAIESKKQPLCSCRELPKLCLCSAAHGSDDPTLSVRSKKSGGDDVKMRSKSSSIKRQAQKGLIRASNTVTMTVEKKADIDEETKRRFGNFAHGETSSVRDELIDRPVETESTNDRMKRQYVNKPMKNNDETEENDNVHLQPLNIANSTKFVNEESETPNENETNIEQMYKNLLKRNRELEEKLEKIDCSLACLNKDKGDEQVACLKDSLEKAQNEAKLAKRSRDLAIDLVKQSRVQTDLVKASRDEICQRVSVFKCNNDKLQCECDELKCKLREIEENETKKYAEVDDKVNKIKYAVKQKESILVGEKNELEKTVAELTNHLKIQKKRICELTSVCTKQRDFLRTNENCISTKTAQLTEAEGKCQSSNGKCKQMQEQIDRLRSRMNEETVARDNLEKILNERQDNFNCQLQIKDMIIGDQVETIKKLKKLLQDSEKMAHQAAREFESLRNELRCLKQNNESLRLALDEADNPEACENEFCDRCNVLEAQLKNLEEQRQKAIIAAKFATTKLGKCTTEYNRQIDCEKRRNKYVSDLAERQEAEILLLKKEILCDKELRSRRLKNYIDYQ